MDFSQDKIRTLRQRLGWSLAEMARQMGCSTDLIAAWESGSSQPDPEALNQLHYLNGHVESNSVQIHSQALAEEKMETDGMAQLTNRDLLNDIQ